MNTFLFLYWLFDHRFHSNAGTNTRAWVWIVGRLMLYVVVLVGETGR